MQIKNVIGRAIGKIILIGEHSVVYGEPAIAIPFTSTKVRTTIKQVDGPIILDCYYYNGLMSKAPDRLLGLTTLIKEILVSFDQELKNLSINIESTIPPERGMGSSAATAISTIRALYNFFEQQLSNEKLNQLVNISESIVHGNPSGIDSAVIGSETPLYYIKDKVFEPFPFYIDAYLIVADTGEQTKTRETVSDVRKLVDSNPETSIDLIKQLGILANGAKSAIKNNDVLKLGNILSEAHKILNKLEVSNDNLNSLVAIANRSGALGAKLTGGGRGGCMIALASDKNSADYISTMLLRKGAINTWITSLRG